VLVLDTSILSILQRERGTEFETVRRRLEAVNPTLIFAAIVSFHEQAIGWNAYLHRARKSGNLIHGYGMFERLLADFARLNVLGFDDAAAASFEALKSQGLRVGTMDLRIAAIALSRGFMVITRNIIDFSRVPGLRSEDWTVPIA
jgi:tRNA(fMet)-specific endonuclease VapC